MRMCRSNMPSLSLKERQFIINCFFENNKSFIVVKREYHAKFLLIGSKNFKTLAALEMAEVKTPTGTVTFLPQLI